MRKILIISYHFPPFRSSGVYRHLKFVKLLRNFGWQPYVLTVRNPSKGLIEKGLLKDIPDDVAVSHSFTLELDDIENRIMYFLKYRKIPWEVWSRNTLQGRKPLLFRVINKVIKNIILIPDDMVGWVPSAILKARSIIMKEDIDLFCTSSPPHSIHLIGLLLKKMTNKPWIADFRDLWTQNFLYQNKLWYREKIERHMERTVLECSNRIVTVSKGFKNDLLKLAPRVPEDKIKVITNGFDFDDFKGDSLKETKRRRTAFVITHIGTLYPDCAPPFLLGLKELIDKYPVFGSSVLVRFVGRIYKEDLDLIEKLRLWDHIKYEGYHNHDEAIQDMMSADLLLLILGKGIKWKSVIPGKIFEYMKAEKPILVLCEYGDAAEMAIKSGLGLVVSHENLDEIKHKIYDCFLKTKNGWHIVNPNHEFINKFDRKNLTKKFAEILDKEFDL